MDTSHVAQVQHHVQAPPARVAPDQLRISRQNRPAPIPKGWLAKAAVGGSGGVTPNFWTGAVPEVTAGDRAAFTFHTHRIDDHSVLKVNVADGNLIVDSTDLNVNSVGQNLVLQRTFEAAGFFSGVTGSGWSNSLTNDVSLYQSGNNLTYVGNDGAPFDCTLASGLPTRWDCPGEMDAWIVAGQYASFILTFRHTRDGHHQGDQQVFYYDGRLAYTANAAGQSTWLSYDANKRVTGVTDTQGRTISYSKDGLHFITGVTFPGATPGSTRTLGYGFDSVHNMTSFTNAAGKVTQYGYDAQRNLNKITDPDGNVINIGYDTQGRVLTLSYPKPGGTDLTTFTYGPTYGSTVTDANGHTTSYTNDGLYHVTQAVDALGQTRTTTYDSDMNVKTRTDNANNPTSLNPTTYIYDGGGSSCGAPGSPCNDNLTSTVAPRSATNLTGATSTFGYSGGSGNTAIYQMGSAKDAQGNLTSFGHNSFGAVTSSTQGTAVTTTAYQGDPGGVSCGAKNGQVCYTQDPDGASHRTTYSYDTSGNLSLVTPPSPLGPTTITVDNVSRPSVVTDGNGNTTTYGYDAMDRVKTVSTSADGKTVGFVYDPDGNVTTRTDRAGTWGYGYDTQGRMTSMSGPENVTYGYDGVGNLVTLGVTTPAGTKTTGYTYTDVNKVASITDPAGTTTVNYTVGQDTWPLNMIYPNGTEMVYLYDNAGRIKSATGYGAALATLSSYKYTYQTNSGADANLVTTMTDTANTVHTYTYTSKNQLQTDAGTPGGTTTWGYDPNGNRTSIVVGGTPPQTFNSAFNSANQDSTIPNGGVAATTYDANGNQTAQPAAGVNALSYNGADQTTSLNTSGGTGAMTYGGVTQDHLHANGAVTYTSPAGLGITNEYIASNWNYDQTRTPNGALIDTTQHLNSVNTTNYYLLDGQGSVVGLTDATGNLTNTYAYDAWGNTTSTTGTAVNLFGYKSSMSIGSLHKFGTRWYNTQTGTFTQPDPQTAANPYPYANNNPPNYSDPTGRTFGCGNSWIHPVWCPGSEPNGQQTVDLFACMAGIITMEDFVVGYALAAYGCKPTFDLLTG